MTAKSTLLALSTVALLNASAAATDLLVPAQFPTIQSAVDAALPGDKVRIANGVYDEGVSVEGKFDLSIKGDDGVFVRMIQVAFSSQVSIKEITYTETVDFQLLIASSNNIDIRFSSFQNGTTGVGAFDSQNVNVRDCDVMFLETGIGYVNCSNSRIAVGFVGTQTSALLIDSTGTLIEDCPLKNAGTMAIENSPFTTVRSNSFKGSNLMAFNTANLLIEGNKFKKSADAGIFLSNVFNSTVQGNAMKKPQGDGVRIELGGGHFLFANKIKKAGQVGIRLASTGNSIDQNVVLKSKQFDLLDLTFGQNSFGSNLFGITNL